MKIEALNINFDEPCASCIDSENPIQFSFDTDVETALARILGGFADMDISLDDDGLLYVDNSNQRHSYQGRCTKAASYTKKDGVLTIITLKCQDYRAGDDEYLITGRRLAAAIDLMHGSLDIDGMIERCYDHLEGMDDDE